MPQSLDPRIIVLNITVNGKTKIYTASGDSPMSITATGTKYANALQNEAQITISNLDKETQDYILSETTPFNLNASPKTVTLFAGRDSYGTAQIYTGNIVSSSLTQPPDIGISLRTLTGNFLKTNVITNNQPSQTTLSQIGGQVAKTLNMAFQFEATDKNIGNYNFAGSSVKQVQLLNSMGGINAFIDDNTLIMKNALVPLTGTTRILNADSGLIGIPEFTEQGLKATFLLDNKTKIGGGLKIESQVYPAINGNYVIYKLGFNITSRDVPFYYIAEAARIRGQ
jgi:hypothetical protein